MSKSISVCSCGSPLVFTFAFSYHEYFCVECGGMYGMMDAKSVEATPELSDRKIKNERKFKRMRKGLLSGGAMLRDCDTCSQTSQPHLRHATPKEVEAHEKAMQRIKKVGAKL